jgi:hypothetical protein
MCVITNSHSYGQDEGYRIQCFISMVLAPLYTQSASYCPIEGLMLNEMLQYSPDWLHGEAMIA